MEDTSNIDLQKKYFENPFAENLTWRTTNPYVSRKERNLLQFVAKDIKRLPPNARIIEIGCGEGPNIALLQDLGVHQTLIGLDLSAARVSYCTNNISNMLGITASADCLPFRDFSFDLVFFRDLLHHVGPAREKVLREAFRIVKPGSGLYFMEANGRNPCFLLLALTTKAERGLFHSNMNSISTLAAHVGTPELRMHEPSNLFRLLFHYSVGFPALAHKRFFIFLADMMTKIAHLIMPKTMWAYICVKIEKNSDGSS